MKKTEFLNEFVDERKDILDLLKANIQSEDQLLLASRILNNLMEGVVITTTDGTIKYINEAFTQISGYGSEAIGQNPRILKSGKHDEDFYIALWKSITETGQWKGEIVNKRKNGEIYIQWSTITAIRDDHQKAVYYTAVVQDITQRKKAEEQLNNDLLLAREVQKGALSQSIHDERIEIDGVFYPSVMLGGDMYAWYKIDDHRYGIFLMDVMGHGVASSLVSMSLRSLLRGFIHNLVKPELVLKELNQHTMALYSNDSASFKKYFLTGIYVLIDTKEKQIQYASAGHPPGFLIDENGNATKLDIGTIPLGMMSEIDVQTGVLKYSGETKIVLYTDGFIEDGINKLGENINDLKSFLIMNRKMNAKNLLSESINALSKKHGSSKFNDDVTMIAVTICK